MSIHVHLHNMATAIVSTGEEVGPTQARNLRMSLEHLLNSGFTNLVIDLSPTKQIDSAGVAALVAARKRAKRKRGDVRIVRPSLESANRIFELTRFDNVFEMNETVDTAIATFGG